MTREGDLVRVNPLTGKTSFILSVATAGEQFWSGLAFDAAKNDLYAVNAFGDHMLVNIDLDLMKSYNQGSTVWIVDGSTRQMLGLEFQNGMLLGSNRQNDNIVKIDPSTGSFEFTWGNQTAGVTNQQQIASHPESGVLYGVHDHFSSSNNAALSTFDSLFRSTELGELPFGIVETVGGGNDTYGWGGLAFLPVPKPCSLGLSFEDDIKWSQPPVEDDWGCINGWDEVSNYNTEPIIADDWVCLDDRPIKDIHWWGSFKGWKEPNPVPPGEMPSAFHIGIWTDVPAGIKWSQLPDPCGLDVAFFSEYQGIEMYLADDWLCTQTGPVTDIRLWFSSKNDGTIDINEFRVWIWSDDPCKPGGYSKPKELLWQRTFNAGEFSYHLDGRGDQEWLDPLLDPNDGWPNHHRYYQVDINDINDPFIQQAGTVYWLQVLPYTGCFCDRLGWKTSRDHWNDDAVYAYSGYHELRDPNTGESLDLAFEIITNGDANAEYSHPGRLMWENICNCYVWSYAGCDVDPRSEGENDACFKFDQLLSQDKWFYQEPNGPNEPMRVYWLSIAAIYDGNTPKYPWG
jgi:hypothetical protein